MTLSSLSDSLKQRMQDASPLMRGVVAASAIEVATTVIAEMLPAGLVEHVKPLYVKNRTLTVTCASSVAAQEIRLRQAEIVEQINTRLGVSEVDRVRYLV
jgi:predicted nucleic acid-binding Zn ribbon protein